jgi:hypothetical protein
MKVRTLLISMEVETDLKVAEIKSCLKEYIEEDGLSQVNQLSVMVADKTK